MLPWQQGPGLHDCSDLMGEQPDNSMPRRPAFLHDGPRTRQVGRPARWADLARNGNHSGRKSASGKSPECLVDGFPNELSGPDP